MATTNEDIIVNYLLSDPEKDSKANRGKSLTYKKGVLYSYSSPICVRFKHNGEDFAMIHHNDYVSHTTSCHLSLLKRQLYRRYDEGHIIGARLMREIDTYPDNDIEHKFDWEKFEATVRKDAEEELQTERLQYAFEGPRARFRRVLNYVREASKILDVMDILCKLEQSYLNFDNYDKIDGLQKEFKAKERKERNELRKKTSELLMKDSNPLFAMLLQSQFSCRLKPEAKANLCKQHKDLIKLYDDHKKSYREAETIHSQVDKDLGRRIDFYYHSSRNEVKMWQDVMLKYATKDCDTLVCISLHDLLKVFMDHFNETHELGFPSTFKCSCSFGYNYNAQDSTAVIDPDGNCRFSSDSGNRYAVLRKEEMEFLQPFIMELKNIYDNDMMDERYR